VEQRQGVDDSLDVWDAVKYCVEFLIQVSHDLCQLADVTCLIVLCCLQGCRDFSNRFHLVEIAFKFLIDLVKALHEFCVELSDCILKFGFCHCFKFFCDLIEFCTVVICWCGYSGCSCICIGLLGCWSLVGLLLLQWRE